MGLVRWNGPDPLADDLPSFNPYVYTFNNPVNFLDPTGLIPWLVAASWGDY